MSTPAVPCANEHCRCMVGRLEPQDVPFDESDIGLGEPRDEIFAESFCCASCRRGANKTSSEQLCMCAHPECDAFDS